ncbi:MAG TPA: glycine betaine ABC transporter substrate-binding protein [Chthonomonadaceae bacterium]|nr:glycine betaine ABC transporter substrate-binding protein [Chthonomonadaceae bacterium]
MKKWMFMVFCLLLSTSVQAQTLIVGSKKFTESYVLGEIARRTLEDAGFTVEHRQGMGATGIVWTALRTGQITLYPEYTGTVSEEILKVKGGMTPDAMRTALAKDGVGMLDELGFNNTYALVMRRDKAQQLGIRTISDLKNHPDLVVRPTPEFLKRQDGWEPLSARYGLAMKDVAGVEHALGYTALANGKIDVKDAYSTDAKIAEYNLVTLEDDLNFFPKYRAVFLYRLSAPQQAVAALQKLSGTINEEKMIRLNAEAERTKDYSRAAALYFQDATPQAAPAASKTPQSAPRASESASLGANLVRWTARHLELVGISLLLAILVGVPLGIVASHPGPISQAILGITGIIQTIPSIALLTMLIPLPFLGIGTTTAIVALFLYSLLPIVRNTAVGLQDIPISLRESAAALGLEPGARLFKIYLPMASRTILAGIKTSAIINVGTATLAAFIGAGGLGEPIVSGLNLNDNATVLQGAIPAAVLALLVQFGFDLLDRLLIPKGLRLPAPRT